MKNKVIIILILLAPFLHGCDCVQYAFGTVIDKQTKEPISGVEVYKYGMEYDKSITNKKGQFEIKSVSGGLFGCPSMKIVAKKEGFEIIQQKGGGTLELKKK